MNLLLAKEIIKWMGANGDKPTSVIAEALGMKPAKVIQAMGLNRLSPEVASALNNGELGVARAYILAKLPVEDQTAWMRKTDALTLEELTGVVLGHVKQIREMKRNEAKMPDQKRHNLPC